MTEPVDHEELSRCLFEESNDALFVVDPDASRILDANPTAQRLTGFRRKQFLDVKLEDIFKADEAGSIEEVIDAYRWTGFFHSKEGYHIECKRGELLPVNLSVSRIHTVPHPLGLVVARDMSEQKRAAEALRQAHGELETRVHERTADLSEANSLLRHEISQRKSAQVQLKESRDLLEQRVRERTAELITLNRQLQQEIDQRRQAQHLLQSIAEGTSSDLGNEFFPSLVRTLATTLNVRYGFVSECLDWPTTRVRALAVWLGDRLDENIEYEVADTPCAETIGGRRTFYGRELQRLFPKDQVLVDLGAESYCGLPICDVSGQVIGHVAVLDDKAMDDDFSDLPALKILAARAAAELHRKRAEEQSRLLHDEIAHVSRLSTMGEMASCLAHEINQPLGVIANNARACTRGIQGGQLDSDEILKALEDIASQALQAGEIIRRLRTFVAKRAAKRSAANLNEIVQDVAHLLQFDARRWGADLRLHLDERLPSIAVDAVQIQQVVVNLVRNAFEAMEEPRRDESQVVLTTEATSDEVLLSVSDTGKGISEETLKLIFEPYFSTKPDGLGMGLSISRSIIHRHGGRLWAVSRENAGTTFQFTLPVHKKGTTHAS